jgi:hypothetical protein
MSCKVRLELKVGAAPEAAQEDTREVFSGIVEKSVGSTLSDDRWSRKPPGQRQEPLYFALHVSQGNAEDLLREIYDYNQSVKAAETDASGTSPPASPVDFINGLRSRYVNRMPATAEGKIIYGIKLESGRLQFRCSKDVTHRQRMES